MFYFIFLKAAFEALGVIAVITNCALIGMAAKSSHWLPDMTPVNAVLLFVAIEVRITLVFFFFHFPGAVFCVMLLYLKAPGVNKFLSNVCINPVPRSYRVTRHGRSGCDTRFLLPLKRCRLAGYEA